MTGEDQAEAVAFLSAPGTYGPGIADVRRIETHISHVFLAGDRAFKLKKAVRYPYLDFSTLEKRRAACEAEVVVNRRTAPGLYKGVVALVRRPDGRLAIDEPGATVDWLVAMARFDEDTLFDRLARRGALDNRLIGELAAVVARFHREAEIHRAADSAEGLRATVDGNAASMAGPAGAVFSAAERDRLRDLGHARLAALRPLLDRRREQGLVRRCHGDLHLRNICLVEGKPVLFDAIEFNETFAVIDVLYDAAFLVMDLDHIGQAPLANLFLNRYLDAWGDDDGLPLLPLFFSLRAAIRAHVAGTTAAALRGSAADEQRAEARHYLEEAFRYLAPSSPRLIAVGGLSGSGKSLLARALAPFAGPAPGARVVRTDVVRKQLAGADLLERLGPEGYSAEMTERTYGEFLRRIEAALDAGFSVVADAVFARGDQRDAVAGIAARRGVPFDGFWLEAEPAIMEARVATRTGNVSDATVDVLRRQRAYDLGSITWTRIDSGGAPEETQALALAVLKPGRG